MNCESVSHRHYNMCTSLPTVNQNVFYKTLSQCDSHKLSICFVVKVLKSLSPQELQRLQQSNRDKLSTINQSVESPEVQAALQRNPDISKERSNLLQGMREEVISCKVQ